MEQTFTVFRGGKGGKIRSDTVRRTLKDHEVFIETTHSGLCGTDEHFLSGGIALGHEGVGIVKQLGADVTCVKVGDRVGFGFTHEICGNCERCCNGKDQHCRYVKNFGSADTDNGCFSSGAVWDSKCVYPIPENMSSEHAAPLMCAGATVFSVLTEYGMKPSDRIGVMGIGGLGHLAIKLAAALGYKVVVLSSSERKREEAMSYGAAEYHVYKSGSPPPEGWRPVNHLILCGSANLDYNTLIPLVDSCGTIYPLTVSFEPSSIFLLALNPANIKIQGCLVGSRTTIRNLLEFSARNNILPTVMTWPMTAEGIETAFSEMKNGHVRYRAVLVRKES